MHLADAACGMMGTSAVVGTSLPVAAGYALAARLRNCDTVVAVFFGDGATEEGVFWETLNFAALRSLPVLFVCENNLYAIHAHQKDRQARCDITGRVAAMGVVALKVSHDPLEIKAAAAASIERMRQGGGPAFLECMTYRWREHVGPALDFHLGYRTQAECASWMADDPVERYAAMLAPADRAAMESAVRQEIQAAVDAAENAPWPDETELMEHVYA
jgi:pyruvate dehydrogenase E1 component alpha subunit